MEGSKNILKTKIDCWKKNQSPERWTAHSILECLCELVISEDIVSGYVRALIVESMHCSTNEQIIVSRLSLEFLLTSLSTQTEPYIDTFRSKRFQRSNSEVIPDGTFR